MTERILLNKKVLWRNFTFALGIIFTILSAVFLFFTVDDVGLDTYCKKCVAIGVPVLLSIIFALWRTCTYKTNCIVDEPQRSIVLRYGDLWRFGFQKLCKKSRIVVVNVNTTFDTIIDPPGVVKPLVSARTVHGQWINQMIKHKISIESIDKQIENSLQEQQILPVSKLSKERGKCNNYSRGTIACCTYDNTTFYLVALSEFDENNNAQNSVEELRNTIYKLIDFIDKNGQNTDVYIPLMGSGDSRTGIDDRIALEILKSSLLIYKDKLHCKVNVVVYEGNRDKISIDV